MGVSLPKSPLMREYTAAMDRLIIEKPKDRSHQIQTLFNRVAEKIALQVEEQYAEKVREALRSLCELKPGRVLLKTWLKLSEEKQVPLVFSQGKYTEYGDRSENPKAIIYLSKDDLLFPTRYSTFKSGEPSYLDVSSYGETYRVYQEGESVLKPFYVTLGHEIIHMIHDLKEKHIHLSVNDEMHCLKGMTNPEENHTISGVNLKLYLLAKQKNTPLKKEDFLCENALLLAARLPVRISHGLLKRSEQIPAEVKIEECDFEDYKNEYYDWLNKNLLELAYDYHHGGEELKSIIPESCLDDEEFLKDAVSKNPYLISFIDQSKYRNVVKNAFRDMPLFYDGKLLLSLLHEELKNDAEFMKDLFKSARYWQCGS